MLKSVMRLALLLLVSVCVLPAKVEAYRTLTDDPDLAGAAGQPIPWHEFPIELAVFEQSLDPVDGATTLDAVEAASELWNQSTCTVDALEVAGLTDQAARQQDKHGAVQWVHADWSAHGKPDAIAITESTIRGVGDEHWLIDGDIFLNADTIAWTDDMLAHLDGVLAHELGHLLGLAHPCEPEGEDGAPVCDASSEMTLMHPLYDASRSALTADDEDGACFLYPDGPIDLPDPSTEVDAGGCTVARPGATRSPHALVALLALLAALAVLRRRWPPATLAA